MRQRDSSAQLPLMRMPVQKAATRLQFALTVGVSALCASAAFGQTTNSEPLNPMQLRLDHVTASVADLDKEESWYERVFGFRENVRHKRGEDHEERHLSLGIYHIDLAWQRGSVRQPEADFYRQGWMHVVFATAAIDEAYARLVKLGTDVRADRNGNGLIWRMFLHDPEGNQIEIVANEGETRSGLSPGEPVSAYVPPPIPESVLPLGQDRELLIRTCTVCHTAELVTAKRRTTVDWDGTVTRMVTRGAVANDEEKARILAYLNKNFGE